MCASQDKPSLLRGLFTGKCPECRRGQVFKQEGILPFRTMLDIIPQCQVCGQRLKSESNNGAGINYALTVIVILLNLLWYWPLFGISFMDDSVFYFLGISITIVVILQPWLMRLSRMIYLYLYHASGGGRSAPRDSANNQ